MANKPELYLYGQVTAEGESPTITVDGVGYTGHIFENFPEYNEQTHPYVFFSFSTIVNTPLVFISPSPIVVRRGFAHFVVWVDGMLVAEMLVSETGREYWTGWHTVDSDNQESTKYSVGTYNCWANHTVYDTSGGIFAEACEPPVRSTLPEVLFEGVPDDIGRIMQVTSHFAVGDTARITVNGVVSEHIVKKLPGSGWFIGNEALITEGAVDDGSDWALTLKILYNDLMSSFHEGHISLQLYHRINAAQQIKIERIAIVTPVPIYDPEALIQGYLVGCRLRAMRGKA